MVIDSANPRTRVPEETALKGATVKAIVTRFTVALALLGCMALTVGAGIRWT
jgi:hypothetical protein